MTRLPVPGLTLGDVAGIGPEITLRALLEHPDLREECVTVVIGDAGALRRAAPYIGVERVRGGHDRPPVRGHQRPLAGRGRPGRRADGGGAARKAQRRRRQRVLQVRRRGVRPCQAGGALDGIVTAPLNKAAMHEGGHKYPGHTELLAEQFERRDFLAGPLRWRPLFFHLAARVSLPGDRGGHPGTDHEWSRPRPLVRRRAGEARSRRSGSRGSTPTPARPTVRRQGRRRARAGRSPLPRGTGHRARGRLPPTP